MALPTLANVNHPRAWGYGASLDNRGGIQIVIPIYLLIYLSYIKYTTFNGVSEGFVFS